MLKPTAAFLLCLIPFAAQAEIFTCTNRNGDTVYTQDPHSANCRKADIGRPSVYSSLPAEPTSYTPPAPAPEAPPVSQAQKAAERNLAEAQKALEEGKKVRYGNERNYAKYLERVAGLEADVKKAQDALNQVSGQQDTVPLDGGDSARPQ